MTTTVRGGGDDADSRFQPIERKTTRHGGDIYGNNHIQYDFSVSLSPIGPPEGVIRAVHESAQKIQCYPDPQCRRLRRALAEHLNVTENMILIGNGASALIRAVVRALCSRRSTPARALIPMPTYTGYERELEAAGVQITRYALREEDDFALTEAFIEAVREWYGSKYGSQNNLLFLCNPANPVGNLIPHKLLERIVRTCEELGIWCVLDECYLELANVQETLTGSGQDNSCGTQSAEQYACCGCRSMYPRLKDYPHLIILRAFTKTYAMPGLRLGYLLTADKELREEIGMQLEEWSVSVPAQEAGIAALNDRAYLPRARKAVIRERAFLVQALERAGLTVYPGEANFIFFMSESELAKELEASGILIRDCADMMPNTRKRYAYRVGIRSHAENEVLIKAIYKVLGLLHKVTLT